MTYQLKGHRPHRPFTIAVASIKLKFGVGAQAFVRFHSTSKMLQKSRIEYTMILDELLMVGFLFVSIHNISECVGMQWYDILITFRLYVLTLFSIK